MKKVIDKAESRGRSLYDWLDSYHTFSFDGYYNPRRMNFGALRVLNDDRIAPGEGFGTHPHKNMEIITIPLKGRLQHGDSKQNHRTITPGYIQTMSAADRARKARNKMAKKERPLLSIGKPPIENRDGRGWNVKFF